MQIIEKAGQNGSAGRTLLDSIILTLKKGAANA